MAIHLGDVRTRAWRARCHPRRCLRVKGENWRYAAYAGTLGIMAIVFQFFWWVALLITGVIIIVAILDNIGDIFGGIFS